MDKTLKSMWKIQMTGLEDLDTPKVSYIIFLMSCSWAG